MKTAGPTEKVGERFGVEREREEDTLRVEEAKKWWEDTKPQQKKTYFIKSEYEQYTQMYDAFAHVFQYNRKSLLTDRMHMDAYLSEIHRHINHNIIINHYIN